MCRGHSFGAESSPLAEDFNFPYSDYTFGRFTSLSTPPKEKSKLSIQAYVVYTQILNVLLILRKEGHEPCREQTSL